MFTFLADCQLFVDIFVSCLFTFCDLWFHFISYLFTSTAVCLHFSAVCLLFRYISNCLFTFISYLFIFFVNCLFTFSTAVCLLFWRLFVYVLTAVCLRLDSCLFTSLQLFVYIFDSCCLYFWQLFVYTYFEFSCHLLFWRKNGFGSQNHLLSCLFTFWIFCVFLTNFSDSLHHLFEQGFARELVLYTVMILSLPTFHPLLILKILPTLLFTLLLALLLSTLDAYLRFCWCFHFHFSVRIKYIFVHLYQQLLTSIRGQ